VRVSWAADIACCATHLGVLGVAAGVVTAPVLGVSAAALVTGVVLALTALFRGYRTAGVERQGAHP
jgi:hypothetical protein